MPHSPESNSVLGRHELAQEWAVAIHASERVLLHPSEVGTFLFEQTAALCDGLFATTFSLDPGYRVGNALVEAGFTDTACLYNTISLLSKRLNAMYGARRVNRVACLLGALAAGYADGLRDHSVAKSERARCPSQGPNDGNQNSVTDGGAHFKAVFDSAVIGVGICDLEGRILDGNPALLTMFGITLEYLRSRSVTDFMNAAGPDSIRARKYQELIRGDCDHFQIECHHHFGDGRQLWTEMAVSLVRDGAGEPLYVVCIVADITERHRLRARLEYAAGHDPLTRLANRTLFFEQLNQVFDGSKQRVGLCFLDLDQFKAINDSLGHQAGDLLLMEVAARLQSCATKAGHLAARVGGDEFVVLLTGTTGTDEVIALADTLLAALAQPFQIAGYQLSISASIGLVERPAAETSANDLVKDADVTLYWAKSQGKGRWALFDADRNAAQVARYTLSAAMPAALDADEFFLEYQPLVRLADGGLVGVEALVRWRHPVLGVVPPGEFITIAEETGLIVRLGRWVLAQACEQAQAWREEFGDKAPFMSVNLAARQLEDPELVGDVVTILAQSGLDPAHLQLEITESALIGSSTVSQAALEMLTQMGIRIALDDFGTGYCNLTYLRRIPVHCLKIAGDFVEGLRGVGGAGRNDEQIVATMVTLAHTLGLSVTAEGIETQAQADRLSAIECDSGQGWHFAKPMPHHKVGELLASLA